MTIKYSLTQLLKTMIEQGASDLHITVGTPPRMRIDGNLVPLQLEALQPADSRHLVYSILTETQKKAFEQSRELDLAFSVQGLARFRANVFLQKNSVGGVFRVVPYKIKTIDELGLPPVIKRICGLQRGLVLVTGPTGSGKSTTLASMLDYINDTTYDHILTIEDPIEFVHPHKNCVVNQRELGEDTKSFSFALKSALRQDPDVIMVGELRDLETISLALTAAETGHLVFGTLHTNNCVSSLNRIIDVFPPHQQGQIRTQLAMTLEAVVSQILVPITNGGRMSAMEIMVSNKAIKALILEGKFNQIYSSMQTGQEDTGMQTMNQALANLVLRRMVDKNMAISRSSDEEELLQLLDNPGRVAFLKRGVSPSPGGGLNKPGGGNKTG